MLQHGVGQRRHGEKHGEQERRPFGGVALQAVGSFAVSAAKSGSAAASGAEAGEALFGGGPGNMERRPWRDRNASRLGSGCADTGCVHNLCRGCSFLGTSSNGASSMITLRLLASRASDLGGADAVLRLAPGAPGAAPSGAASSL